MHRIAIAITTRLQDQGEGLTMLPMNPLPILFSPASLFFLRRNWHYSPGKASYFPEEVDIIRQIDPLFHPQPGSVEYFHHQTEINNPLPRKGHHYKYLQSVDGDLFSPVESPSRTSHTHNSFITSFHSIRMHTTFAFISWHNTKHLMHHDIA